MATWLERGACNLHMVPADATAIPSSLALAKPRWSFLTASQVVLEKRLLNCR